ncbi:hypothetical protein [Streptomonospora salina]|uniref:Uncharacterized protein n=1 Tax=Streptomonospora salina TaxID=104205 RepID=A0A841EF01_9ACTN|nr:hypothetical protein [Streptomonospora salina]MBB6000914.1 hypothetical protein [Streptomonospora salina]
MGTAVELAAAALGALPMLLMVLLVAVPAVWSRDPARRERAIAVLLRRSGEQEQAPDREVE